MWMKVPRKKNQFLVLVQDVWRGREVIKDPFFFTNKRQEIIISSIRIMNSYHLIS